MTNKCSYFLVYKYFGVQTHGYLKQFLSWTCALWRQLKVKPAQRRAFVWKQRLVKPQRREKPKNHADWQCTTCYLNRNPFIHSDGKFKCSCWRVKWRQWHSGLFRQQLLRMWETEKKKEAKLVDRLFGTDLSGSDRCPHGQGTRLASLMTGRVHDKMTQHFRVKSCLTHYIPRNMAYPWLRKGFHKESITS